jgi:hypothetical protein
MSEGTKGFGGYHVICLSPLAKIFQPAYHKQLMKNPDLVYDAKMQFDVIASKPSGDITLPYNKVIDLTKFFGRSTNEDRKIIDCFNWLTGGEDGMLSRETDKTGCVLAPVDLEMTEMAIEYTQLLAEDPEAAEKFKKSMMSKKTKTVSAMDKAREISNNRVMRTVHTVYDNLKKQQQLNRENNLGSYIPSPSEFLCAWILKAEETKTADERKRVTESFAELMSQSITPNVGASA